MSKFLKVNLKMVNVDNNFDVLLGKNSKHYIKYDNAETKIINKNINIDDVIYKMYKCGEKIFETVYNTKGIKDDFKRLVVQPNNSTILGFCAQEDIKSNFIPTIYDTLYEILKEKNVDVSNLIEPDNFRDFHMSPNEWLKDKYKLLLETFTAKIVLQNINLLKYFSFWQDKIIFNKDKNTNNFKSIVKPYVKAYGIPYYFKEPINKIDEIMNGEANANLYDNIGYLGSLRFYPIEHFLCICFLIFVIENIKNNRDSIGFIDNEFKYANITSIKNGRDPITIYSLINSIGPIPEYYYINDFCNSLTEINRFVQDHFSHIYGIHFHNYYEKFGAHLENKGDFENLPLFAWNYYFENLNLKAKIGEDVCVRCKKSFTSKKHHTKEGYLCDSCFKIYTKERHKNNTRNFRTSKKG